MIKKPVVLVLLFALSGLICLNAAQVATGFVVF
jgi:hypothetical protein